MPNKLMTLLEEIKNILKRRLVADDGSDTERPTEEEVILIVIVKKQ